MPGTPRDGSRLCLFCGILHLLTLPRLFSSSFIICISPLVHGDLLTKDGNLSIYTALYADEKHQGDSITNNCFVIT